MVNAIFVILLWSISSIISLSSINKSTNSLKYYTVLSIIIFFVVTFRDGSSLNDYSNYIQLYIDSNRSTEVEPSFIYIKNIAHFLGGIFILFLIYAFLCVFIKVIAIYRLTNLLFLTLVIYISNIMILHDMTQIRAGVASGIFLYSIPYLARQEKIKYLVSVLIATFFHYSGILFFLPCLFWINRIRISKWFYLLIIPIGYILGGTIFDVSHFPIEHIRFKLEMYKNLQNAGVDGFTALNIFNPYIIFRIVLFYLLLWKRNIILSNNPYFSCLLFIEAIAIFVFPAFSSIALLGYRGSELLGVVEIILYPMLYYIIKPKFWGKLSVIGIGGLLLVVNLTYKHLIYL